MITGQVKDLCYGLYGKTAVPIDPEVQKKALKGYDRGEEPITCRPAEVLEPELEKAKEEIGDLAVDLDDLVIYAIYPVTGKKFLQWKYGKEEPPAEVKPITLEQVKKQDEADQKSQGRRAGGEKEGRPGQGRKPAHLQRLCGRRVLRGRRGRSGRQPDPEIRPTDPAFRRGPGSRTGHACCAGRGACGSSCGGTG